MGSRAAENYRRRSWLLSVTFDFEGKNTIYGGNYVIVVPALADDIRHFVGKREAS